MDFVTNEKLTIVGAAGMIGSNMAQTALMMRLTPNICLYDPYAPALEGVAEELYHCAFEGVNITWTSDIREALTDASYVVSSGGAARKAGMTREDLLKGNTEIAAQLGKDIRTYCPGVKHVVVVFNPADITGLVTLIYAGIRPSQLSTLAALDSTDMLGRVSLLDVKNLDNMYLMTTDGARIVLGDDAKLETKLLIAREVLVVREPLGTVKGAKIDVSSAREAHYIPNTLPTITPVPTVTPTIAPSATPET